MDGGKGLPYFGLLLFAPRVLLVYASIYTGHTYITFIYIAFLSILRLQYVCCIMSECVCVCIVAAEVTESIHFLFSLFFSLFLLCVLYVCRVPWSSLSSSLPSSLSSTSSSRCSCGRRAKWRMSGCAIDCGQHMRTWLNARTSWRTPFKLYVSSIHQTPYQTNHPSNQLPLIHRFPFLSLYFTSLLLTSYPHFKSCKHCTTIMVFSYFLLPFFITCSFVGSTPGLYRHRFCGT